MEAQQPQRSDSSGEELEGGADDRESAHRHRRTNLSSRRSSQRQSQQWSRKELQQLQPLRHGDASEQLHHFQR